MKRIVKTTAFKENLNRITQSKFDYDAYTFDEKIEIVEIDYPTFKLKLYVDIILKTFYMWNDLNDDFEFIEVSNAEVFETFKFNDSMILMFEDSMYDSISVIDLRPEINMIYITSLYDNEYHYNGKIIKSNKKFHYFGIPELCRSGDKYFLINDYPKTYLGIFKNYNGEIRKECRLLTKNKNYLLKFYFDHKPDYKIYLNRLIFGWYL